jgi:hypothetical protein
VKDLLRGADVRAAAFCMFCDDRTAADNSRSWSKDFSRAGEALFQSSEVFAQIAVSLCFWLGLGNMEGAGGGHVGVCIICGHGVEGLLCCCCIGMACSDDDESCPFTCIECAGASLFCSFCCCCCAKVLGGMCKLSPREAARRCPSLLGVALGVASTLMCVI